MIIKPRYKSFICTNAHPTGCDYNVQEQIRFIKSKGVISGPKKALIIGASNGYGLASRITCAFGYQAATIGLFYEKTPKKGKTASSGWYHTASFTNAALKAGLYVKNLNADTFSQHTKDKIIQTIQEDLGTIDLIIYSIAAPFKKDEKTEIKYTSVLKPTQNEYIGKTVDFHTRVLSDITIPPATETEIQETIQVMGGDDWFSWIEALSKAKVLSENCITMAYSYVGPEQTKAIYRTGTIGKAKEHLEKTALRINQLLHPIRGKAYISINKAVVTQASAAIPVIPLYISCLDKIMKEKGIYENCIEQIYRLFATKIYGIDSIIHKNETIIRMDDLEMREDIQQTVQKLWKMMDQENVAEVSGIQEYRKAFFKLFGFGISEIDYERAVEEMILINNLII